MSKLMKKLNLVFIQDKVKTFQEISSEIRITQEQLEDMLSLIDSNTLDFNKGKISKEVFQENDNKLRKESKELIKKINSLVDAGIEIMESIIKQAKDQIIRLPTQEKKVKS
ncbi:MAG: hypothetical protein QXR09_01970 [Candidatus Aenigmatarchaeota archaeon]